MTTCEYPVRADDYGAVLQCTEPVVLRYVRREDFGQMRDAATRYRYQCAKHPAPKGYTTDPNWTPR